MEVKMEQLSGYSVIQEQELNKEFYFQSLFYEACNKNLLTASQIERIQLELIELMAKEVERYTNDESSSVPMEQAQELLHSITYQIGFFLKKMSDMEEKLNLLKKEKLSVMFFQGMEAVSVLKVEADQNLKYLIQHLLPLENISYQDTIRTGLSEFFHDYNIEFGAHILSGDIDYPLAVTITGLLGIEYIDRYLHYLKLENDFLECFDGAAVNQLLHDFSNESEHILVNIFELVLVNSFGCILLGQKGTRLHIGKEEILWLQNNLEGMLQPDLEIRLVTALEQMKKELVIQKETIDYIKALLPQIAFRIVHNLQTHTLDKIFISCQMDRMEEEYLEEGIKMDDSILRHLIEKLKELNSVADKVLEIKKEVRSLPDLTELLEECFYPGEYQEVFQRLGDAECSILRKYLLRESGVSDAADFELRNEWQAILFHGK